MTATTNAPRATWAHAPVSEATVVAVQTVQPAPQPAPRAAAPAAGSIEDLGRQLLAETNAARCVAYRRSRSGQLIWQHEVAADDIVAGDAAVADAGEGRAAVQITRPVRDAFGQIIGVIQTRESSDPTF